MWICYRANFAHVSYTTEKIRKRRKRKGVTKKTYWKDSDLRVRLFSGMKSWYLSLQALLSDSPDDFFPMEWVRTWPSTPSTSTLNDEVDLLSASSALAKLDRRDPGLPRRIDASLPTVRCCCDCCKVLRRRDSSRDIFTRRLRRRRRSSSQLRPSRGRCHFYAIVTACLAADRPGAYEMNDAGRYTEWIIKTFRIFALVLHRADERESWYENNGSTALHPNKTIAPMFETISSRALQ